jgi:hypothetical protein
MTAALARINNGHIVVTQGRGDTAKMPFDRAVDPTFRKLRKELFRGDLTASLDDSDGEERASHANVRGVAIEIGTNDQVLLFLGLRDGTASVYRSSGGGLVGGGSHAHLNAAAKALVAAARSIVEKLPIVDRNPLPAPGRVIISILTAEGVRAGEDEEAALMAGKGVLYPLFLRGNDIANGYQHM